MYTHKCCVIFNNIHTIFTLGAAGKFIEEFCSTGDYYQEHNPPH